MTTIPEITVCICTYRRGELLSRLLEALALQDTANRFTFSVVVADNDATESGRSVVERLATRLGFPVHYCVESRQNIALARNRAVAEARGDFIAFIDDDEFPVPAWLGNALASCQQFGVAGVLGPVEPHFDHEPPAWIRRGGFYCRPRHQTGFEMPWSECRTGNVLLRRSILQDNSEPFRSEFGSGGEDQDFFRRMIEAGHRFVWCDEAVAYEVVPASRCKIRFLLKRALLRGRNTLRHPKGRWKNLLKSVLAVPVYAVVLPFSLAAGLHLFVKYLVRMTDHVGRLLAALHINPVRTREM